MERYDYTVTGREAQLNLIEFVAEKLELSKRAAKRVIDSKNVQINGERIWMAKAALNPGDRINIQYKPERKILIQELYRDQSYIVFDKPADIPSNGKRSFEEIVQKHCKSHDLRAAHRLDKDTTGCLIFATDKESFESIKGEFQQKKVVKHYTAIVEGVLSQKSGEISQKLDGKDALSRYSVIRSSAEFSLLDVEIITGRKHQIRRHLTSIGYPVVGDTLYGRRLRAKKLEKFVSRCLLHSTSIEFTNPLSEREVHAEAPLPQEFRDFLEIVGIQCTR